MELTEQQLRFFDAFGFLKFPGLFAEEMGEITNAFEQVWAKHGVGRRQSARMTLPLGPVSAIGGKGVWGA